jgi:hypothetical protein
MSKLLVWRDAETEEELDIQYALIDGYNFGGRFLENVMFKVAATVFDGKIIYIADATDEAREYLTRHKMDVAKWEEEATKYATHYPDSFSHPELPGDVYAEVV